MPNYNGSQVGVPYVRVPRIVITYGTDGVPKVVIEQSLAVKLADNSIRHLEAMPELTATLDLAADGTTPIPLVSPEDGSPLGADTTLQQVFLAILAVVRKIQTTPPPEAPSSPNP